MELTFEQLPSAVAKILESLERIEKLLNLKDDLSINDNNLLNIQETAEFLNLKVATIYGHVHKREIPNNKVGKRLYFVKSDLIEWVKSGKRKTLSELKADADSYLKRKQTVVNNK